MAKKTKKVEDGLQIWKHYEPLASEGKEIFSKTTHKFRDLFNRIVRARSGVQHRLQIAREDNNLGKLRLLDRIKAVENSIKFPWLYDEKHGLEKYIAMVVRKELRKKKKL